MTNRKKKIKLHEKMSKPAEDKVELLTSASSNLFGLGKEKHIAVKVIDHRGNEVKYL